MAISANLKRLLHLLSDGEFHSGTELSQLLGVTRSAISKQLQGLDDLGVELAAVSGKGYKLTRPMQLLSLKRIEEHLSTEADRLLNGIEIHDLIASTNDYLLQKSHVGGESAVACFAEYQSSGKGRRGRSWVSPFGSNIYLSILWRYQGGPAAIAGLSLAVGVAVVRALTEFGVNDVGLKWPNDIYWQQQKLAGILIEVAGEAGGPCQAIIGLGINCYIPQKEAQAIDQAWTDLDTLLGRSSHEIRNRLAAELLNHMMPIISGFETCGLSHYLAEWRKYDCMQGKSVDVYMGTQRYCGIVEGIDDQGLLLIREENQQLRTFASGEVSFRKA